MTPSGASTYTFFNGNPVVSPSVTSTYSVVGTSSQNCVSTNTAVSTVTVYANPTLSVSTSSSMICAGETSTLTVSGAASYLWNGGEAVNTITVMPSAETSYTVTGTSIHGCTNTAMISQAVSPCTGLETVLSSEVLVSVFPNPNNGHFTIAGEADAIIFVYNELGQSEAGFSLDKSNDRKVAVSGLATGVYFIRIQSVNHTTYQKIIVSQ
jgi:hypothetical protein